MEYTQISKKEYSPIFKICNEFILKSQKQLKKFCTFRIDLVGSYKNKLICKDSNGVFDIDFTLVIQKLKKESNGNEKLKNEEEIYNKFFDIFNKVSKSNPNYDFKLEKSSSVITIKKIENKKLLFSMDVAISDKDNKIIIFDKSKNRFIKNERKDYQLKTKYLKEIKRRNQFETFKQEYFELKNKQKNQKPSILILLDLINTYKQKFNYKITLSN